MTTTKSRLLPKRTSPTRKEIANLESVLIRFMEASKKRHDAMDAALREKQASLWN